MKFLQERVQDANLLRLLLKEYEDEEKVVYRFGPNEEQMGKIELNKKTKYVFRD